MLQNTTSSSGREFPSDPSPAVVLLEDGVLGAHVQGPLLGEGHRKGRLGKRADGLQGQTT